MRLIHITDPHLTPLDAVPAHRRLGKRMLGYLSWQRRRRWLHRPQRLAETLAAVEADSPDLILLGGDLCQIGLPEEIAAATDWLRRLNGIAPVLLVPGNHDIYRADSSSALLNAWRPWLHLPAVVDACDMQAGYPVTMQFPGLTVIGLDSAVPTAIGSARGRLGRDQIERLGSRLAEARVRGDAVCVLLHHPPLPGQTGWRKALADADALAGTLRAFEADVVLHGHLHRNVFRRDGGMRVFGTASASGCTPAEPAAYRIIDIQPHTPGRHAFEATLKSHGDGGFVVARCEQWLTDAP